MECWRVNYFTLCVSSFPNLGICFQAACSHSWKRGICLHPWWSCWRPWQARGKQSQGSCSCWCHCSMPCRHSCSEHWSWSWENFFLPGSVHPYQDFQGYHRNYCKYLYLNCFMVWLLKCAHYYSILFISFSRMMSTFWKKVTKLVPAKPHCLTCSTFLHLTMVWSLRWSMTPAQSLSLRSLTSSRRICVLSSWRWVYFSCIWFNLSSHSRNANYMNSAVVSKRCF